MFTITEAYNLQLLFSRVDKHEQAIDAKLRTCVTSGQKSIAYVVEDTRDAAEFIMKRYQEAGWNVACEDVGSDRAYQPLDKYKLTFLLPNRDR